MVAWEVSDDSISDAWDFCPKFQAVEEGVLPLSESLPWAAGATIGGRGYNMAPLSLQVVLPGSADTAACFPPDGDELSEQLYHAKEGRSPLVPFIGDYE